MGTERYSGIDDDGRTVEIELTPLSRPELCAIVFINLCVFASVFLAGFLIGRWIV